MLPWKRHKFELLAGDAEEAQQPRGPPPPPPPPPPPSGKAPGAWGAGSSAWARACPPEGALSRVGKLFRCKRQKFRVSREAPTYTVLYLGNATTLQAKGDGCTDGAVGKIWAKSEAGRHGTKMKLTIGPQGIRLAPAAAAALDASSSGSSGPRAPSGHLYLLHRVTYCVADPRLPRLFAWIYRHEVKHKAVLLRCHAVLVSKAEKARAMALLLYQTSAAALADFRRLKKRADARHQHRLQLQHAPGGGDGDGSPGPLAVPPPPRRLLLLPAPGCCYKPPVERSRSAPKLGSITEDALGEELEERAGGLANGGGPGHGEDGEDDGDEEELPGDGDSDGAEEAGLGELLGGLGELALGNDVALLRADLRVTRLLSGESTGSESSIESSGPDGGSPEPGGSG